MKIDFPLSIKICESDNEKRNFYASLRSLLVGNVIVLTGPTCSYSLALDLLSRLNFKPDNIIQVDNNSVTGLTDILDSLLIEDITVLAVGGGKVCDIAKRLVFTVGGTLIIYPTVVSNDGLLSPIAVMSSDESSVSLPAKMPDHLYIDLSIIRSAPSKFLIAAAFDLLSNISATQDWRYAEEHGDEGMNHLAFQLSRMAANQLLDCVSWDVGSEDFLRAVIHGQILSAMSMAYAGSSRPCSGSEHLISHALDKLNIGENLLHGQKVGRATLFTTYLHMKCVKKMQKLFSVFNCRQTLVDEVMSDETLLAVFQSSRTVRPGRNTVLDEYSDQELLLQYRKFEKEIIQL